MSPMCFCLAHRSAASAYGFRQLSLRSHYIIIERACHNEGRWTANLDGVASKLHSLIGQMHRSRPERQVKQTCRKDVSAACA
jgi:hypothetical protein